MKVPEIGELHLAAIIGVATLLGGLSSAWLSAKLIDVNVARETDVELVQLAISVLTKPREDAGMAPAGTGLTSERVLRRWAVDTINAAADDEVKFDAEAQELLVNGDVYFSDFNKVFGGDWTTRPEAKPFVR